MDFLSPAHFLLRLRPHLQPDCLLCGCRILRTRKNLFGLCHACHASLPHIRQRCSRCAIPLPSPQPLCGRCISSPPHFTAAHSAVCYERSVPALIHQLKHQHEKAVIHLLADLFCHSLPSPPAGIDLIIPVPMHFRRNLLRGNNHCDLLADAISRKLGIPCHSRVIRRVRSTPPQQQLSAEERRTNLQNAFVVQKPVKELGIALLDDVHTTGSTMNEIAKTLKQAGAKEVHAWSMARAVKE